MCRSLLLPTLVLTLAAVPGRASAVTTREAIGITSDAMDQVDEAARSADRKLARETGGSRAVRAVGRTVGRVTGGVVGLAGGGVLGGSLLAVEGFDTTISEEKDVEAYLGRWGVTIYVTNPALAPASKWVLDKSDWVERQADRWVFAPAGRMYDRIDDHFAPIRINLNEAHLGQGK
jgi:hypothetical protein